jgi:adenine phosphoribosyltransferase
MKLDLKKLVTTIPNFPKAGVQFLDIAPIVSSGEAFQVMLSQLSDKIDWKNIDTIIGIESRGFILGAALAAKHFKGFVPCRKSGKLPPPVISESYTLEYGTSTLEIHPGKGRALIVDDILATGGTLKAAYSIAQKAGYEVQDMLVLINIEALNEMKFKSEKVKSLLQY